MLKNLVYLTIFTTFIVLVWIGVTIYHNFSTTTISEVTQIQIVPIKATFDRETISNLKKRKQIKADLSQPSTISSTTEEETTSSKSALLLEQNLIPTITAEGEF